MEEVEKKTREVQKETTEVEKETGHDGTPNVEKKDVRLKKKRPILDSSVLGCIFYWQLKVFAGHLHLPSRIIGSTAGSPKRDFFASSVEIKSRDEALRRHILGTCRGSQ